MRPVPKTRPHKNSDLHYFIPKRARISTYANPDSSLKGNDGKDAAFYREHAGLVQKYASYHEAEVVHIIERHSRGGGKPDWLKN